MLKRFWERQYNLLTKCKVILVINKIMIIIIRIIILNKICNNSHNKYLILLNWLKILYKKACFQIGKKNIK